MREMRPTLNLSYEQAQDLLRVLDNTRLVLESYVAQAEDSSRSGGSPYRYGRWRRERGWWAFHCFPDRRRSIARFIFIITLVLQVMNLFVVTMIDRIPRHDHAAVYWTAATMFLVQLLNLFFIIIVSVRLGRQLYKHKVSMSLLAQSYISTLLLFAGIYTLMFRLEPKSWKFIQEDVESNPALVFELYSKFLFYSVSTATLCGSDNVLPIDWYNCIFAAIQMLTSFIYFASILGQTLSQDTRYWLGVGPKADDPASTVGNAAGTTTLAAQTNNSSPVENSSDSRATSGIVAYGPGGRNYGSGGQTTIVALVEEGGAEGGRGDREQTESVDMEADSGRNSINKSPFPL